MAAGIQKNLKNKEIYPKVDICIVQIMLFICLLYEHVFCM